MFFCYGKTLCFGNMESRRIKYSEREQENIFNAFALSVSFMQKYSERVNQPVNLGH